MKARLPRDCFYMARDFCRVVSGRDYFHQPQPLGAFFCDSRCYYNDMAGKAVWRGKYIDGVPALYIPSWRKHITLPVMVLQYGIGNIDTFFLTDDRACLGRIANVTEWVVEHLNAQGYLDSPIARLDPTADYWSGNSAMSQGEALSFLVRVVAHDLVDASLLQRATNSLPQIFENMVRPLEEDGTAILDNEGIVLCEYCRKDDYVVLNGWIYAIFGLFDYLAWSKEQRADEILSTTLQTLSAHIPRYVTSSGWSYYDNHGRVSSPFYHSLHICLLDALSRLTGDQVIVNTREAFAAVNTISNRIRFTAAKIKDKITDSFVYTSQE